MTQFSDWIQANWFELGTLVVLSAFLATAVWFARNILRSLRASQEQMGALLRMSVSEGVPAVAPLTQASPAPAFSLPTLLPSETTPAFREIAPGGPGVLAAAWHGTIEWLNAPMHHSSISPWHKLARWLQAPAGS